MKRRFWLAVARFAVRQADRGAGYDWTEDDSLTGPDIRARMSLLPRAEVVTSTSGLVQVQQPQTWGTSTGATIRWQP